MSVITRPGWCAGSALWIAEGRTRNLLSRKKMTTIVRTARAPSWLAVRTYYERKSVLLIHNSSQGGSYNPSRHVAVAVEELAAATINS